MEKKDKKLKETDSLMASRQGHDVVKKTKTKASKVNISVVGTIEHESRFVRFLK